MRERALELEEGRDGPSLGRRTRVAEDGGGRRDTGALLICFGH